MSEHLPSKDQLSLTPEQEARAREIIEDCRQMPRWAAREIVRLRSQVEELSIHAEKWVKRALDSVPEPCVLSPEAQSVLINAAQLIDGIKNTAPQDWTEWDQQVRDSISALLATKPAQADLTKVVDVRAAQPPGEGQ